jgi:hypothetical protein
MLSRGSLFFGLPRRTVLLPWLVIPGILELSACSGDVRPPYIDDRDNNDRADDGDKDDTAKADAAAEDEIIAPPPDNSGNGACETVVEVPIVKPNFYFVIDASGSMTIPLPGETISRYQSASVAIENMLSGVQTRVNFGAALFPNPTDGASCNAGAEVFTITTEDHPQSKQGVTLEALLTTLSQFIPEGGSPVSSTLAALQPTLLAFKEPTYVFLLSDGAPNCNPEVNCGADQCIPNIEGLSFDNGIVCDEATNCCQPDWLPHLCLDEDATNTQLGTLAEAGISTYVIGMPGSITYSDILGRMAEAGGTQREGEELLYYQVNDAPDLAAILIGLGQEILVDCQIALDFAPTAPDLLHIYADEEEIPTEGWQLTGEQTVELLGDTCEQWRTGQLPEVRVRQTCTPPVL